MFSGCCNNIYYEMQCKISAGSTSPRPQTTHTPLQHSSTLPAPRQPADPAPGAAAGARATPHGPALTLRSPHGPALSLPWSGHPGWETSLRWVYQNWGAVCWSSDAVCLSCYAASLDHLPAVWGLKHRFIMLCCTEQWLLTFSIRCGLGLDCCCNGHIRSPVLACQGHTAPPFLRGLICAWQHWAGPCT